jgi:uncharacterized protein YndB with AHSA1/START domain
MKIELKPDFLVTEETCQEATGKTISEWIEEVNAQGASLKGRREAITWMKRSDTAKDIWWATTVWVEKERREGTVKKDGLAEGFNICATKMVAAPVDKVFAAFATPGPAAWFDGTVESDHSLTSAQGHTAKASRVRQDKDLRYVWQTKGIDSPTDLDVMFAEKNGKTGITLSHSRIQTREEADGVRAAWGEALNKLKAELES